MSSLERNVPRYLKWTGVSVAAGWIAQGYRPRSPTIGAYRRMLQRRSWKGPGSGWGDDDRSRRCLSFRGFIVRAKFDHQVANAGI